MYVPRRCVKERDHVTTVDSTVEAGVRQRSHNHLLSVSDNDVINVMLCKLY